MNVCFYLLVLLIDLMSHQVGLCLLMYPSRELDTSQSVYEVLASARDFVLVDIFTRVKLRLLLLLRSLVS